MRSFQPIRSSLRYGIIRAGLELTAIPFMPSLFPGAGGRGVVFTLHHVRPSAPARFSPNAHLSVTPAFLEEAIKAVLEQGLIPVHLHDLPTLLADKPDRRRFVAFTLDDGYRNNATFAAPVFRKFGVPYTIFISSGFVERNHTAWWETAEALIRKVSQFEFDFGSGVQTVPCKSLGQKLAAFDLFTELVRAVDEDEAVRRIDEAARAYGISPVAIIDDLVMDKTELRALAEDPLAHFGAHTVSHVNLRRVKQDRLLEEIERSAHAVEQYAGKRPRSFSYPYGWRSAVSEREMAAVAEAGFPVAVTTQPGVLGEECLDHPMKLPRISLNGYYQKKRYVKALVSGVPFRLLAENIRFSIEQQ